MTHVVVGEEKIRRPTGLKQRGFKAIFAEFVFVRIDQIGIGMRLQQLYNLEESVRLENIIMIEKNDPFTTRQRQPSVRCRRNSSMAPKRCGSDPPISHAQRRQSAHEIGSGRSVVDQQKLPVSVNLRHH